MEKKSKHVDSDCCPFNRLPNEIILHMFNMLMDLRTLCFCQMVSKRLCLIARQVDALSFEILLPSDYDVEKIGFREKLLEMLTNGSIFKPIRRILNRVVPFYLRDCDHLASSIGYESFPSAAMSMKRFTMLKSIFMKFPSCINVVDDDDDGVSLFNWKIAFENRVDSFVFLAEDDSESEGHEDIEDEDSEEYYKAYSCLMDAIDMFKRVLGSNVDFPLLEKVFIVDSDKRGAVTLGGEKLADFRNLLSSSFKTIEQRVTHSVKLQSLSDENQ